MKLLLRVFMLVLIPFLILSFFGCSKKQTAEIEMVPTYSEIKIDKRIKNIMAQFVEENKTQNCINKIYIDKQGPYYSIFTMESGTSFLRSRQSPYPLYYTTVNGARFFIYNGTEEYFQRDEKFFDTLKVNRNYQECSEISWSVIDSSKVIKIIKRGGYPFFPLPTEPSPPSLEWFKKERK